MKDADASDTTDDPRIAFLEQASRIGMHALIELIREQRLSGGKASLRIEVDGAVWEITAKCILRKGPPPAQ